MKQVTYSAKDASWEGEHRYLAVVNGNILEGRPYYKTLGQCIRTAKKEAEKKAGILRGQGHECEVVPTGFTWA